MDKIKEAINTIKKSLINPDNKLALIPNWLSFSRVIGSYAIPIMVYTGASAVILLPVIGAIALSDFLDGKVARLLHVESEDGALMDAVSDKIFSINLILGLLPKNPIFLINGALEGLISYTNSKAYTEGKKPKSSFLGKIKTWPLFIGLGLGYLGIAMQNQGINIINPDIVIVLSNVLSATTIPLEIINLKEYQKAAQQEEIPIEIEEETQEELTNEKQQEHQKQKGLTLDKETKISLMIYEPKKEEKVIENQKKLTK